MFQKTAARRKWRTGAPSCKPSKWSGLKYQQTIESRMDVNQRTAANGGASEEEEDSRAESCARSPAVMPPGRAARLSRGTVPALATPQSPMSISRFKQAAAWSAGYSGVGTEKRRVARYKTSMLTELLFKYRVVLSVADSRDEAIGRLRDAAAQASRSAT